MKTQVITYNMDNGKWLDKDNQEINFSSLLQDGWQVLSQSQNDNIIAYTMVKSNIICE